MKTKRAETLAILEQAVSEHCNILVSGTTGTGKTTLCNALLKEVSVRTPSDPIYIIDSPELVSPDSSVIRLDATADRTRHQCFGVLPCPFPRQFPRSILHNVKGLSVKAPSPRPRVCFDEIREQSDAVDLFTHWQRSLGGLSSIHADHPYRVLQRLEDIMTDLNPPLRSSLIADTQMLIVHLERNDFATLEVTTLIRVVGYDHGTYRLDVLLETAA